MEDVPVAIIIIVTDTFYYYIILYVVKVGRRLIINHVSRAQFVNKCESFRCCWFHLSIHGLERRRRIFQERDGAGLSTKVNTGLRLNFYIVYSSFVYL